MFFNGLSAQESHFSDKGVKLADTYDSPVYGYATEQIKAALRLAYSIYEKIAYFLNEYYSLGLGNTGFSHVWYTDGERSKGLHDKFENSHNWPLNALFWVKKDFYGGPLDVSESVEEIPATAEEIRHALEHRYLSVHDEGDISTGDDAEDWFNDDLKEQITRSQLVASGLEMLKTARRGLVYLSLAVHYEEQTKTESDVDREKNIST